VQEIMALFEELRGLVPKEQFLPVWRKASKLAEIIRGSEKKNIRPSPERLGELEALLGSISQMPRGSQGTLPFRGSSPAKVASPAQQQSAEFDALLENLNRTDVAIRPRQVNPMLGHNNPPR